MKHSFRMMAISGVAGIIALTACTTAEAKNLTTDVEDPFMPAVTLPAKIPADFPTTAELPTTPITLPADLPANLLEVEGDVSIIDFAFFSWSGTVAEVRPFVELDGDKEVEVEGKCFVLLDIDADSQVNFLVDPETVNLLSGEIEVGMELTGFYDTSLPTTMIYPPQYHAVALAEQSSETSVMVDRFDADLMSNDGEMQISISDETEIVLQDGTPFEGGEAELANRAMVVEYMANEDGSVTISKIVVLFERAVAPILTLTPEDIATFAENLIDPDNVSVIVNEKEVKMPKPYVNSETGLVMVPVAEIAKALGKTVVGEGADVVVGRGSIFTVGVDNYNYNRMASIQLGAGPELVDDVLFVPMHYFGEVFPNVGVYVQDGNVIVNSAE